MPMMILTKSCKVQNVKQPVGHRFDVPEKEARLWAALGRAKISGPVEAAAPRQQQSAAASDSSPQAERRSARYNRRDMRAED